MSGFRGGIHPPDHKSRTDSVPIRDVTLPAMLVVPLQQHIGRPATACVKPKQEVAVGEMIGQRQGPVSADVHSPATGTVKRIDSVMLPTGRRADAVAIETASEQGPWPWTEPWGGSAPRELVVERIEAAGVVGMGGAGFPTAVKMRPPEDKPVDTLVVNGCECEPYLTADHRLMVEWPRAVAGGVKYLMRALGVARCVVAVEDNKPGAVIALHDVDWPDGVTIKVLPTRYPQGAEKMLIAATLGRNVPSGGLPMDVGVDVQNVATVAACARAVCCGEPLIRRIVTVTGPGIREPGNFRAPIGMSVGDLIAEAGGFTDDVTELIFGGPMMGLDQAALDTPITKTTSGIIALTGRDESVEAACLRCGRCVDACPMGLLPVRIARAARRRVIPELATLGALDCMECGCCAWACPSQRDIVPWVRLGKRILQSERVPA